MYVLVGFGLLVQTPQLIALLALHDFYSLCALMTLLFAVLMPIALQNAPARLCYVNGVRMHSLLHAQHDAQPVMKRYHVQHRLSPAKTEACAV